MYERPAKGNFLVEDQKGKILHILGVHVGSSDRYYGHYPFLHLNNYLLEFCIIFINTKSKRPLERQLTN